MEMCSIMFSARAVFPIDGRAPMTTNSEFWKPLVMESSVVKPLVTPVQSP